jgi:hypothetical protein
VSLKCLATYRSMYAGTVDHPVTSWPALAQVLAPGDVSSTMHNLATSSVSLRARGRGRRFHAGGSAGARQKESMRSVGMDASGSKAPRGGWGERNEMKRNEPRAGGTARVHRDATGTDAPPRVKPRVPRRHVLDRLQRVVLDRDVDVRGVLDDGVRPDPAEERAEDGVVRNAHLSQVRLGRVEDLLQDVAAADRERAVRVSRARRHRAPRESFLLRRRRRRRRRRYRRRRRRRRYRRRPRRRRRRR